MLFIGGDLAVNHAGIVVLTEDGRVPDLFFTSHEASLFKGAASREVGIRIPKREKGEDYEIHRARRLAVQSRAILQFIGKYQPEKVLVGLEGYMERATGVSYQIGEVGGVVRVLLWEMGYTWRTYEPMTVKMGSTGKGNAEKEEVLPCLLSTYPELDVTRLFEIPFESEKEKDTFYDLTDALAVAVLLREEYRLRAGLSTLDKVPEGMRRVFLRVDKRNPTNLLDRPWTASSIKKSS